VTPAPAEGCCELCGVGIEEEHGHVVNLVGRSLLCVCRPCYLLFTFQGAGGSRFRAVPTRYQALPDIDVARDGWDAPDIPIGRAFFFRSSLTGKVSAFYPSPAGATESELPLDAWDALVRAMPDLSALLPDVEALIVRRREASQDGLTALLAPIDACYELVGRVRRAWRGIQGGDDVAREIDAFFARAVERARVEAGA
jgi:hypothetical protein